MGHHTKIWTNLALVSLLSHHFQWKKKKSKYQYYHTVVCARTTGEYFTPVTRSKWHRGKGTVWDLGCLGSFLPPFASAT